MCVPSKKSFCKLPTAILFLGLGISSLIYTPFDFIYDLRLRMLPGTPAFEFWANPPDNTLMKVFIFNITNSEKFLNGSETQLELQEIGPIIFREKLSHTNIVFNENSTLSYTATRTPIYIPEKNSINLNDTIIAPNIAILVMASYFSDSYFLVRASINMLINRYKSQPLVKMSIYNYLFNATDPVLEAAKMFGGEKLVPSVNVGVVTEVYRENKHNLTVLIGPKYRHKDFFLIETYDRSYSIPGFKNCKPKFINTSETTLFPQFLKEGQPLFLWKDMLCKIVKTEFTNETSRYGMKLSRYDVSSSLFDRIEPLSSDCYKGSPVLPNGVSDISACNNGFPLVASFPHFLNADPIVSERLKGLNPNIEEHGSFLVIDKISGVPLSGKATFQVSLNTKNLNGFNGQIPRFSNMYLPMSYIRFELEELPWYIFGSIYFMSVIIPNTQLIMSIVFISISLLCSYYLYLDLYPRKQLAEKILLSAIETEKFLK